MSGSLNHPPAKIIIRHLVAVGLAVAPAAGAVWPCYYGDEPDEPDNCLTVYDTDGKVNGREHVAGEVQEHYGIQVRLRCAPNAITVGFQKLGAIMQHFDKTVNRTLVPYGSDTYRIQAISRTSGIVSLGRESITSKRRIYVMGAIVSLRLLPGTGSY